MVKVLNREGIQRMVGKRVAEASGSGGEGGGGISLAQVDAAYVSKAFFDQLFTVHGKRTYTDSETQEEVTEDVVISPNQIAEGEYSLSNVEVSVGLWTNSFLSALGLGTGGGGGGATALTDLVDVALSNPQNGQVLTYDATLGKWKNADAQGGGGTDMQTVWQNLAASGNQQINASHLTSAMLRIDHTFDTVDANNLKGSGSHRLGEQGTNFPVSYPNYGQMLVVNGGGDTYAQLYFPYTSSDVYIRTGNPDNPSTGQWNAWKKVLTEGNAVTSVAMTVPTGFSVTGSPITSSGTLALSFASGYSLPTTEKQSSWDAKQNAITDLATIRSNAAHGETAYGWGNHANAGYLTASALTGYATQQWVGQNYLGVNDTAAAATKLQTARKIWGQLFDGTGNITGNMEDVGIILQNGQYTVMGRYEAHGALIESLTNTVTIGLHNGNGVSWDTRTGSGYMLQLVYESSNTVAKKYTRVFDGLRIGDGMLVWDSGNNALKVINANGTAANLYATGGVSALGMSAGVSTVDAMTFNHLSVKNSMTLSGSVSVITGSSSQILRSSNDSDCIYLLNFGTTSKVTSSNYYFNQYDNVGLHGTDYNYGETWFIDPDGCAKFNRLYLDSTRYLYINGGTLYYYNGSSSRQIAFA